MRGQQLLSLTESVLSIDYVQKIPLPLNYSVNRQILFPRKALFQSNKIKMLLKQPALFSGRLF